MKQMKTQRKKKKKPKKLKPKRQSQNQVKNHPKPLRKMMKMVIQTRRLELQKKPQRNSRKLNLMQLSSRRRLKTSNKRQIPPKRKLRQPEPQLKS